MIVFVNIHTTLGERELHLVAKTAKTIDLCEITKFVLTLEDRLPRVSQTAFKRYWSSLITLIYC